MSDRSPSQALTSDGAAALHPVLSVIGLTKRYGSRTAVDGLSFDLPKGTVTGFIGPNGAGKTTTLRMLLGLVTMSAGRAEIAGRSVGTKGWLDEVGAMIEGPAFYPALSARRNLTVLAAAGGIAARRADIVLEVVGLTDRAPDRVSTFSLGMRQRLGIAAALLSDPEVILLDEPTNGLDPSGIREMRALMRLLADQGKTILVSSHLLGEIEQICDRLVMIREGRLVFSGAMHTIAERQRTEVIARPNASRDLARLSEVLTSNGRTAAVDDDVVRVDAAKADAATINRLAFEAGITLTELRTERQSLEQTFFAMMEAVKS